MFDHFSYHCNKYFHTFWVKFNLGKYQHHQAYVFVIDWLWVNKMSEWMVLNAECRILDENEYADF